MMKSDKDANYLLEETFPAFVHPCASTPLCLFSLLSGEQLRAAWDLGRRDKALSHDYWMSFGNA